MHSSSLLPMDGTSPYIEPMLPFPNFPCISSSDLLEKDLMMHKDKSHAILVDPLDGILSPYC